MVIGEAMGDPDKPMPDFSVVCTTMQGKQLTQVQRGKYRPKYSYLNPKEGF